MQKVADDKGLKVKKGGAKGKKDDGPAQNGDTKTNEVWKKIWKKKMPIYSAKDKKIIIISLFWKFVYTHEHTTPIFLYNHIVLASHTHMHADKHTHTHRSMCPVRLSVCHPSEARLPPWCQWEGRVRQSELRVRPSVSNPPVECVCVCPLTYCF